MTPTTTPLSKHLVLRDKQYEIEDTKDEIFVDLHEGPGTQFLAGTCYGQAVIDCQVIGSDFFLLKVRPDMRGLLLSQLGELYKAFRCYTFKGEPESRIFLTDEIFLRFDPEASAEVRRASLRRFFPGSRVDEVLEDGVYHLSGTFSNDPILVSNALQSNPMILEATPLLVAIPNPVKETFALEAAVAEPEPCFA